MDDRLILVVDDDEAIRALVADVLTDEGYQVETAGNGTDALRVINRVVPALLLDLQMPPLDGFALMRVLGARGVTIPTILMSATTNLPRHATNLGAAAFIGRPFEIEHLLATVALHCTVA
jgi:DNA-binding response OmpR family regulator